MLGSELSGRRETTTAQPQGAVFSLPACEQHGTFIGLLFWPPIGLLLLDATCTSPRPEVLRQPFPSETGCDHLDGCLRTKTLFIFTLPSVTKVEISLQWA